jgi:LmbE family N-acetylglucosaminyl deacetylase
MSKLILISRRRHYLIIFISLVLAWGAFWIYREYQTLPQYIMPTLPDIEMPKESQTVLIFAPHCDDETIATGGYIKKALNAEANVKVILSTNGDGHYFSTMEEFGKIYPKANNYIESGYDRQNETKAALSLMGLDKSDVIFLGYPDQGTKLMLTKYWDKPYKSPFTEDIRSPYNNSYHSNQEYTGINLENDIYEIINKYQPNIVIVSNPNDKHPDHAALYEYVYRAIGKSGFKPDLYTYLVHFDYFPNPNGLKKDKYLTPPLKLIGFDGIWHKLELDNDLENLKQVALEKYKSQIKVPFLRKLMVSFVRKNEIFLKMNY